LRGVSDHEHISHLVELFAVESRLIITQAKVPNKKCERKALPELLNGIDITGAIISADAHYLYQEELKDITKRGGVF
jgi:hypothetical protein